MLIDTEDSAILAHLNPAEVQTMKNITQLLAPIARQRVEQAAAPEDPYPWHIESVGARRQ